MHYRCAIPASEGCIINKVTINRYMLYAPTMLLLFTRKQFVHDALDERNVVDTVTAKSYYTTKANYCQPCWCSKWDETDKPASY